MDNTGFRQAIRDALQNQSTSTEEALRLELVKSFDLGCSGYLQFEIDGLNYRISLIQTEADVLKESFLDSLPTGFLDEAEATGHDLFAAIEEELVQWFADRWCAVRGPHYYSPAYAFFHGGLSAPRFDLEKRLWCSVEAVWPDEGLG